MVASIDRSVAPPGRVVLARAKRAQPSLMPAAVKVLIASLRSTLTAEAEGWVFGVRGGVAKIGSTQLLRSVLSHDAELERLAERRRD